MKTGALIHFIRFLSNGVALYFYKSSIWPCMEYCFHSWVGAPSSYLDLLDKLQKWICRTVGPSLAASLEPLSHHSDRLHDFSVTISRCYKDVLSTVSFLAQLGSGILGLQNAFL